MGGLGRGGGGGVGGWGHSAVELPYLSIHVVDLLSELLDDALLLL